ncbi:MAG: ABC transporter permease [Ruminococcaceae bacterium]|nr:ABC transporter permease [Oscillospiraceae bacterium]
MNEVTKKTLSDIPADLLNIPAREFGFVRSEDPIMDANFETVSRGFFKDAMFRLRQNKAAIAAFWIICAIAFMAIFGPNMNEYHFSEQFSDYLNMPPRIPVLENFGIFDGSRLVTNRRLDSLENPEKFPEGCIIGYSNPHEIMGVTLVDVEVNYYKYIGAEEEYFWLGTDHMGRDVWTRLWRGTRVSLIIAVLSTMSDVIIGIIYGAIAGYYGGKVDMLMMRFTEILNSIPSVVLATLFIMMFGTGMWSLVLALCLRGWVGTARMIRTQFLRFRGREYVMAAQTMGVPDRTLIFRHILPNAVGPLITRTMVAIPSAIFTESFMAYLGLGLAPPEPSIGTMLAAGQTVLMQYPHLTLFPALTISVLMIAFNLFGNGLRTALDPTQRGQE